MAALAAVRRCFIRSWGRWVSALESPLPAAAASHGGASCCSMSTWAPSGDAAANALSNRGSSRERFPVAIVGAGPTGLTLSILLSKLGVPHVVLERAQCLTDQPQAHFINHRSMEIFRGMDGLAEEVRELSPPLEQWRNFVYCTAMLQHVYGTIDHFPGQETALLPSISPEPVTHLPQNRLLPLLLERAERYSGTTARVRFGAKVTGVKEIGDQVTVTIEKDSPRSTSVEKDQLTCSYLIAADGANSAVRNLLGIAMEGDAAMQNLINIHFFSEGLAAQLIDKDRPAMLYFCFNPSVIAVVIAHSLEDGEFVAQIPYFPPLQDPGQFTKSVAAHLVRAAAGADIDVRVESVRPWTMSAQVATRFQRGRAFLAGDAAHRFPPAGGFGMNTGIQDAHNLAWKLAAWHSGSLPAPSSLLATYESERRSVAQANTALSVRNFEDALRVPRAMGLDPMAARFASAATSALTGVLPQGLPAAALESCLAIGRMASSTSVPVFSTLVAEKVKKVMSEGQTLRLQFPAEDLGFRYRIPGASGSDSPLSGADRGAPYQPSTSPGGRLPHCNLELLEPPLKYVAKPGDVFFLDQLRRVAAEYKRGSTMSSGVSAISAPSRATKRSSGNPKKPAATPSETTTVDAVSACGGRPLLILGEGGAAADWLAAAVLLRREGFETQVLQILPPSTVPHKGAPYSSSPRSPSSKKSAQKLQEFHRCSASAIDTNGIWQHARGVSSDGAVLVRPDGHVSWRWDDVPQSITSTDMANGQSCHSSLPSPTSSAAAHHYQQRERRPAQLVKDLRLRLSTLFSTRNSQ